MFNCVVGGQFCNINDKNPYKSTMFTDKTRQQKTPYKNVARRVGGEESFFLSV